MLNGRPWSVDRLDLAMSKREAASDYCVSPISNVRTYAEDPDAVSYGPFGIKDVELFDPVIA